VLVGGELREEEDEDGVEDAVAPGLVLAVQVVEDEAARRTLQLDGSGRSLVVALLELSLFFHGVAAVEVQRGEWRETAAGTGELGFGGELGFLIKGRGAGRRDGRRTERWSSVGTERGGRRLGGDGGETVSTRRGIGPRLGRPRRRKEEASVQGEGRQPRSSSSLFFLYKRFF
jgi:hypothetical protein